VPGQLPDEGMFPAAPADNQDPQRVRNLPSPAAFTAAAQLPK